MATRLPTGAQNGQTCVKLIKMLPFWQDAMVVMLKSLMPGCFFNIVGFGSTYKSLFPTSQNYDEVKNAAPRNRALKKK